MKTSPLFALLAANMLAQEPGLVDRAIEGYNQVTKNCVAADCNADAEEAAKNIFQRLIVSRAVLPPSATADVGDGRRIALRLLPERQTGASPGAGGGTSLTSLASVTELISAAMESGAFQRNTAGTISTVRVNPAGVAWLFSGNCPPGSHSDFPACITEDRSPWRGLSMVASFDSSRSDQVTPGNAVGPTTAAGAVFLRAKRGLASAGVRYDFYRPANQRTKEFRDAWEKGAEALREKASDYSKAFAAAPLTVMESALKNGVPAKLHALLQPLAPDGRKAAAEKFVEEYLRTENLSLPLKTLSEFQTAKRKLLESQVKFFGDTLDRRLFSLEFQHQRPKDEPEYGSLTFIWGDTAGTHKEVQEGGAEAEVPNWSFTANAGANFFYEKQKIQKDRTLRDIHVSFQADHRLWRWKVLNQPTFTLAGYYQRLTDDAVLSFNSDAIVPGTGIVLPKPANVILKDTKGNVGIVQAKLTIPLKDTGVSFPLAVTWSNRTELLRLPGNDVRGHFGLQFDLDKLFSGLQPRAE